MRVGLTMWFGFKSNSSLESCVAASQHAACQLCCGSTVWKNYNQNTGTLTLCKSSCAYLTSECGGAFGVGGGNKQFCDWMMRAVLAVNCPKSVLVNNITEPLLPTSSCIDLAAGLNDDILFTVLGILGSSIGLLAGLYYLCIATRLPNLSLFIQAFVASSGIYALSNIATLIDAPQISAAIVIPVILAILPGVTAGYIAVTLRRVTIFIAGATIGLAGAAFLLSAIQGRIVAAIHISAQAVGLVLAALGVIIGAVLACKFTDTVLKINFAVLGASLLIVSISTFISGPQLNIAALFTSPLHYGCTDVACWVLWALWPVAAIAAALIAVKFGWTLLGCCGKAIVAGAATTSSIPLLENPKNDDDV